METAVTPSRHDTSFREALTEVRARNGPTCVLVDDHALMREGMRALLEGDGVRVLGEASSGSEALAVLEGQVCDVVLVDLRLPDMDGLELTARIRHMRPDARCVIVSAHTEGSLVRRALDEGCQGYISKSAAVAVVSEAVLAVSRGETFIDPSLIAGLISGEAKLSGRELEVLQLMAAGQQNQGIAYQLGLSTETVKTHAAKLMSKLGAQGRTDAVAIALRRSLIF